MLNQPQNCSHANECFPQDDRVSIFSKKKKKKQLLPPCSSRVSQTVLSSWVLNISVDGDAAASMSNLS